ncbi:UDP-3-O-(3-hydroxymyristoyl)glucosamine N-acyltransferase [Agaribacterium haliotis]|uniref:UDP-3-O-(3-hydroxymyristoyl)glucosamine N-acyltransferase n=1 Tax=Agaribacterium haliotis TaxID=2013869 RepID=UPI000BB5943E|nr:UDP-3-O-(3-hydroxymyristoyl)glucosamine N-acyltransferase [Agaribacterium haliotis]
MNGKSYTLEELAALLDARLEGEACTKLSGLADLNTARQSDISFLSSSKFAASLAETRAGAVVLSEADAKLYSGNKLISASPYLCYAKLSALFASRTKRSPGVHASAVVDDTAVIGNNVAIGANCVIGAGAVIGDDTELYSGVCIGDESKIGARSLIFSNVVIYHQVELGDDVTVHANTTIGADGFGFAPSEAGWTKIHQIGRVVIGNRVEIGANTSIDRGALGDTVIEDGVIIDNQVHIAHNVKIGEASALAGCTGIAGSTSIGKRCQIAGMVGINGHISIADDSYFHGGTTVTRGNREKGHFASTPPLQDIKSWQRNSVRIRQLDELFNRVKELEKQLNN